MDGVNGLKSNHRKLTRRVFIKVAGVGAAAGLSSIAVTPAQGLIPVPANRRLRDGVERAILFDSSKCIGCRVCIDACKNWNELDHGEIYGLSDKTWIDIEPNPIDQGTLPKPLWARESCMHCSAPACGAVCPVDAISKYDEGPVLIDQETCVGCGYCVPACPFDAMMFDFDKMVATKCHMCYNRIEVGEKPYCVKVCPPKALEFGPYNEILAKAKKRAEETGGRLYGEAEAGGTHVFYVLRGSVEDNRLEKVSGRIYGTEEVPVAVGIKSLLRPLTEVGILGVVLFSIASFARRRGKAEEEKVKE